MSSQAMPNNLFTFNSLHSKRNVEGTRQVGCVKCRHEAQRGDIRSQVNLRLWQAERGSFCNDLELVSES